MACLFELGIYKPIQNLAILTNAGGPAVITSDLIDLSHSLSLATLSEETKDKLRKVLPPMAGVNNPVDIIGDALSTRYESALDILEEEKDIKAIITILTPQMMTEVEATAQLLVEHSKKKTIIPVFIGGSTVEKSLSILSSGKLINFNFPKDIIESLDNLAMGMKKWVTKNKDTDAKNDGHAKPHSVSPSLKMLDYNTMVKYFDENKIAIKSVFVKEKDDLREALNKLNGDDFSMKVISPDVIHKTDMGAVTLHIKSLEQAENAWDKMLASVQKIKPDAQIEGIVLQKMAFGKEIIIGMKRDVTFGPSIVFGMGGIFTEALKDTSLRIAPVTKEIALQMMQEIRGANILNGLRGEEPIAFDKLADLIVSISNLAMSHPEIMEIDLNPVMVSASNAEVVDARMMVSI
jgi:acetyltransferase